MANDYQDDEFLLHKLKTGDEHFVKQIFHSYWPAFNNFLAKNHTISGDGELDIYAQTFTIFYFNIKEDKITAPLSSTLKTYLFGIGKKVILRYLKNEKKHHSLEHLGEDDLQKTKQLPEIIDYFDLEWQQNFVQDLLSRLDNGCRQILELSFIQEYVDEAIQREMNIPSLSAVRQRRLYCLNKLRTLVKQFKKKT